MQFPVYKIEPNQNCYCGTALIVAESVDQANNFIDDFIRSDRYNKYDSWGYGYVIEDNRIDCLFSTVTGILDYGIWYKG